MAADQPQAPQPLRDALRTIDAEVSRRLAAARLPAAALTPCRPSAPTLIELTPGPARLDPPPHSPLRDTQTLRRQPHMPRRQPTFTIQHHQAPDRGLSRQPLIPPSQTLLTHARFPPAHDPRAIAKVIGDNGTYRANAPTDSSMSRPLTTR
jgi:hypothetical protein